MAQTPNSHDKMKLDIIHAPDTQLTHHTKHGHKMKINIFSRARHPTHATHQSQRTQANFEFMFSHSPDTHLT